MGYHSNALIATTFCIALGAVRDKLPCELIEKMIIAPKLSRRILPYKAILKLIMSTHSSISLKLKLKGMTVIFNSPLAARLIDEDIARIVRIESLEFGRRDFHTL